MGGPCTRPPAHTILSSLGQRPPKLGHPQRSQCQATSLSPAMSTAAAQGPLPTWCPSVHLGLTVGWSCESAFSLQRLNLDSPGTGRDKQAWGEPPDTAWHCPPWEESGSCDSHPHQPLSPSFLGELDDSRVTGGKSASQLRTGTQLTTQTLSAPTETAPLRKQCV